jgi:hypothetical protein
MFLSLLKETYYILLSSITTIAGHTNRYQYREGEPRLEERRPESDQSKILLQIHHQKIPVTYRGEEEKAGKNKDT